MTPVGTLSLAELCRLADVTPRTVRYYIGQGLLPSPGAGPNARYSEGHLARLRLIRRLQRGHLPLAQIRRRLEDLPDEQVVALTEALPAVEPGPPGDSAAEYVRRLIAPSPASVPPAAASATAILGPMPRSVAAPAPAPASPAAREARAAYPSAASAGHAERSTWERHAVAPDVEIHVRRPLDRHTSKQVDRLIRVARDLLGDEG